MKIDSVWMLLPWTCFCTFIGYIFNPFLYHRNRPLKIKYNKKFSSVADLVERKEGFDLFTPTDVTLGPLETIVIDTGIVIDVPSFLEASVREKPSNALNTSFHVRGGVINPNYKGNIGVILWNHEPDKDIKLEAGTVIARIIFNIVVSPELELVENVDSKTLLTLLTRLRGFGRKMNTHT